MATIANLLATRNHADPTGWKSPDELQAQSQKLRANDAAIKQQELETQTAIDALREQKVRQRALMDAMNEAGDDLNKVGSIYAQKTGDRAGAENWIKTISQAQSDAAKAKGEDLTTHINQGKAISTWLHGGVESAKGNPDAFQFYIKQNMPALESMGLKVDPAWISSLDSAESAARSLDAANIIANEELKKRELGVQEGNLAVNQLNAQRQQDELNAKNAESTRAKAGQILSSVQSQAEYDAWRKEFPEEAKRLSPFYNPKMLESGLRQFMSLKDQQSAKNDMLTTDWKNYLLSKADGFTGDFNQWQTADANRKAPKTSVTVNNNPDSLLTVTEAQQLGVPYGTTRGQAAGITPSTEGERLAATYADRMQDAEKALSEIIPSITRKGIVGGVEQMVVQGLPNVLKPDKYQQFDQAKRNFINSVLRRESGAVISPSEIEEANKQYFPVAGDTEDTLKLKKQNRDTAIAGMRRSAGGAARTSSNPPAPTSIVIQVNGKKYKYKGSGATDDMSNYSEVK